MSAPLISIVIPAYNAGRYLGATLDGLRAQTLSSWECIVVDDGSTDDTAAVTRRYAGMDNRIRCVRQANKGLADARNGGFARTGSTGFVTFMDSDDVWLPDALETLYAQLKAHPEAVAVSGLAEYIDGSGRLLSPGEFSAIGRKRHGIKAGRVVRLDPSEPTTFSSLAWTNSVWPPGVLLGRRKAYELAGPFDPRANPSEDWDMMIRMSRYGDIGFVDRVVLHYRRHSENMSKTDFAPTVRFIQHKTFFSPDNTARHRQMLAEGWRAWQRLFAQDAWSTFRNSARSVELGEAARSFSRVAVAWFRQFRGHPTLRGL